MKILSKYVLKNVLANKVISLLIILSLVISTAILYLNMTVKDQMLLQYKSILQGTYQDYNYYIYKNGATSEKNKYFNVKELNLSSLKVNSLLELTKTSGVTRFDREVLSLNLYGMDLKLLLEKRLLVLEQTSAEFDPAAAKQIIVSQRMAEKYGLHLKDVLRVSTLAGEQEMTIGGIAENKGLYLNENNKIMLFSSFQYVGYLNGMGDKASGVYVQKDPSIKQEQFDELFKANNQAFSKMSLTDDASIKAELHTTNQLLSIVLFAVILMVFYLNASNTKIILAKRMPEIATLRSIGATRLTMNLILLAENVVYGLVSGIAGVILGVLLKEPVISSLSSYGKMASSLSIPYDFNIRYVIYSVGLTVVFQVGVSLYGILSASRKSLRASMLDTVYTKADISRSRSWLGIVLWGLSILLYFINTEYNLLLAGLVFMGMLTGTICLIPLLTAGLSNILTKLAKRGCGAAVQLGSTNLAGNKINQSSIILVTVTLSIMLTVYLTTVSINHVFEQAGKTFEGDIQITGLSEPAAAYNQLDRVNGVQSLQPVYYSFRDFTINNYKMNIGIFGLDHEMLGIKDVSGKMSVLLAGEALIDRFYGPHNDLNIGDRLTIKSDTMDAFTIRIVGYIHSGNFTSKRNVLVVSPAEYMAKVSRIPNSIEIKTTGDLKQVKDDLSEALAGTSILVQTVDEFLAGNKSGVDSLLMLINLILGLSVLIAFTGVIINQLIGFLQRKKEYAVLYSLGMSKLQINRMILTETAGIFITGCLFSGVLGLFLAKALEQILFCIGEYVSIGMDIVAILKLLAVMFLLLMLTSVLSIRRMPQLNVVQELKYE
ncbi:FtsX-like permease family protein [Paenibacillus sp. GCM10012306]|uniref:FtsX-like permease family protein n=1 Tax=Paenibacillus sp. GCM10012306 TaxID=3317342 RepID=UPI003612B0E0